LEVAIDNFTKFVHSSTGKEDFDFFTHLLPKIQKWALEVQYNRSVDLMLAGKSSVECFKPQEVRYFLANAFFLNIISITSLAHNIGDLSFLIVYHNSDSNSIGRVMCQLSYFYQIDDSEDFNTRVITFSRHLLDNTAPKWTEDAVIDNPSIINLHIGTMEESDAKPFVDFANRYIHIGRIIPSLTQEEVLFSCCPEAFLSLLFIEEMRDNEIVLIKDIRRFSTYKGYLHSFEWTGLYPTHKILDTIVVDAVSFNHFTKAFQIRDLNKAYLSFVQYKGQKISTGHWGCGAFGGSKIHKFLQQLCAAKLAEVTLDYSTFKNKNEFEELSKIYAIILEKKYTVGHLVKLMLDYDPRTRISFEEYIIAKLHNKTEDG